MVAACSAIVLGHLRLIDAGGTRLDQLTEMGDPAHPKLASGLL
jgi:hypothetical protein